MPEQPVSAQLKVKIEGAPLADWIQRDLVAWEVLDNRSSPDSFLLRFSDQYYKILDGTELRIGAKVDLAVQTAGSGAPKPLLVGEITAVELDYADRTAFAVVRGLDASHRLYRGRRTESYEGQQVPQVVDKVAKRAGLTVGDPGDIPQGTARDVVNQTAESDAAFLTRLARAVGARWWVVERRLYFKPLQPPAGAPAESTPAQQNNLVIDPDHGLVSLLAVTSAAGQVGQVQVPGWDPVRKQAVLGRADVAHPGVEVAGPAPGQLAGSFGTAAPTLVYNGILCTSQDAADAAAKSIATQVASGFAELDGTAVGNPDLRADVAVTIGASVRPFAGKYLLTGTRHYQNRRGVYLTDFIASGWSDRSLTGLIAAAAPETVPATNLMIGLVKNVDDPDAHGRVRVSLPGIGEHHKSGWLPVMYPGAGKAAGVVAPLAVDAQVVVAVPGNDPDAAVVLGGLHNQQDELPKLPQGVEYHDTRTGAAQGICITAPGGAQVAIVDTPSVKLIRLATADARHTVEIDQANNAITVSSDGKIAITGRQGVTIDAGSGGVEIKGATVTVNGQSSVTVSGRSSVEVSGSTVAVKGQVRLG